MKNVAKVLSGMGILIALGLILSHWKGAAEITKEVGTQVIGVTNALTLATYNNYPAENSRAF